MDDLPRFPRKTNTCFDHDPMDEDVIEVVTQTVYSASFFCENPGRVASLSENAHHCFQQRQERKRTFDEILRAFTERCVHVEVAAVTPIAMLQPPFFCFSPVDTLLRW